MPSYSYEFAQKVNGTLNWFDGVVEAKDRDDAFRQAKNIARTKVKNYNTTYGGVYAGPLIAEIKEKP